MTTNGKCTNFMTFLTAIIVAASLMGSAFLIAGGLKNFRNFDRYVTVKGLAMQDVTSDLAIWPLRHAATGNSLPETQAIVEANTQMIIAFLKAQGLAETDIVSRKIDVQDLLAQNYRPEGAQNSRYIVAETITVRTNDVDAVNKAAQNIGNLLKQGVSLTRGDDGRNTGAPEYIFTKLNDIKPGMIAAATQNARESAQQFANDSGAKVGQIKDASQGVFEIFPRDSNNSYEERTERNKTVRVVATLKFYLE